MTPVYSYLVLQGWHGSSSQLVVTVGETPKRFRIMALARTRLAGRGRWLDPGKATLVPKSAVRHGEHSKPYTPTGTTTPLAPAPQVSPKCPGDPTDPSEIWRSHPDLNWGMVVLQMSALAEQELNNAS